MVGFKVKAMAVHGVEFTGAIFRYKKVHRNSLVLVGGT